MPVVDSSQDCLLLGGTFHKGWNIFAFRRMVDTGDHNDIPLTEATRLLFAMGPDDATMIEDDGFGDFQQHVDTSEAAYHFPTGTFQHVDDLTMEEAHGSLMLYAWGFFSVISIFCSRYMKDPLGMYVVIFYTHLSHPLVVKLCWLIGAHEANIFLLFLLSFCISISVSITISMSVDICIGIYIYIYICDSLNLYQYLYLYIYTSIPMSIPISIPLCLCLYRYRYQYFIIPYICISRYRIAIFLQYIIYLSSRPPSRKVVVLYSCWGGSVRVPPDGGRICSHRGLHQRGGGRDSL